MICEILEKNMQSKIEIYHDGPTEDQIINLISPEIKGFTFKPIDI